MPSTIEIYENTLLKLLVRRGSDSDRQNIVLTEGELGYTIDTKRLFIGDSQTPGGIAVGTGFLGTTTDVTTLLTAAAGDYAYDTDNNTLYVYQGNITTGGQSNILNWKAVGGVYAPDDETVTIASDNKISVGKLSAGNASSDLLGNSLVIDTNNRVALSSDIATNSIMPYSSTYLKLPQFLRINNVSYTWPSGNIATNYVLTTDIAGNLSWAPPVAGNTVFVAGSASQIPVGSIMPFVSSGGSPQGWLLCNGQQVLSSSYAELFQVIGTSFNITGTPSGSFNVPNLIKKTIYGVSGLGSSTTNNPATSTLFNISSGTNSTLSATGMLYIIKAKPDFIVNSSFTVSNGLTSTVNGQNTTGSPFNPLSGNLAIGLPILVNPQTITGGKAFAIDQYGRTTGTVTELAGTATVIPSYSTPVYNGLSPITFLQTPIPIFRADSQNSLWSISATTISAYPTVTILPNTYTSTPITTPTAGTGVPSYAKNLIVDCDIWKAGPDGGSTDRFVTAGINTSSMAAVSFESIGTREYMIGSASAAGGGDSVRRCNQAIIPLSATSSGNLTCAFRISPSSKDAIYMRIIGYTV